MAGPEPVPFPSLVGKILAIHDALADAGVGHGFGGAIALAYAVANPRATDDIDINISVPVTDAERVLTALPPGIRAREGVLERIAHDGQDRLRWDETPIDLFFPQHRFHAVVAARTAERPFAGTAIPVISPTDLVVFKTMFDRTRDWPDIEAVLRAGTADEAEVLRWTGEILGEDSPARVRLVELIEQVAAGGQPQLEGDPNVWKPLGS